MMSSETTRDRRTPLFGAPIATQSHSAVDVESLERQNDEGIATLGDRVGLLRNITSGIHGELQTHHNLLDRMSQGMGGAHLGLGATVGKFRHVMDDPQARRTTLTALGFALFLFLLYLWTR